MFLYKKIVHYIYNSLILIWNIKEIVWMTWPWWLGVNEQVKLPGKWHEGYRKLNNITILTWFVKLCSKIGVGHVAQFHRSYILQPVVTSIWGYLQTWLCWRGPFVVAWTTLNRMKFAERFSLSIIMPVYSTLAAQSYTFYEFLIMWSKVVGSNLVQGDFFYSCLHRIYYSWQYIYICWFHFIYTHWIYMVMYSCSMSLH